MDSNSGSGTIHVHRDVVEYSLILKVVSQMMLFCQAWGYACVTHFDVQAVVKVVQLDVPYIGHVELNDILEELLHLIR